MKEIRKPISWEEFEIFHPLFYVMSYEEYLKEPCYHEIVK